MSLKTRITSLTAAIALATGLASQSMAGTILITQFENSGYAEMEANLEAAGHTVDIVNATVGGALATALGGGGYTQLFLWDLTSTRFLNQADLDAVEAFYGVHNSMVIDSRSYGYHFQPNQASEVKLLQNIAEALDDHGGGIWIGTDHAPSWTQNANPVLIQLGFDPISGSHSEAVNNSDPNSILLDGVTVSDLWGAGASIGHVSLGIQPNGKDMRFHVGHSSSASGAIPYISASFGTYIAPEEDPDDHLPVEVPEPGTLSLLGLGLAALFTRKRQVKA